MVAKNCPIQPRRLVDKVAIPGKGARIALVAGKALDAGEDNGLVLLHALAEEHCNNELCEGVVRGAEEGSLKTAAKRTQPAPQPANLDR